jgi:TonB-linked SusC/RagA family outer membrane protein
MLRAIVKKTLIGLAPALLLAAIPLGAAAQEGQIVGTITDAETGGPLGTVQVYLEGTTRGALTSATGTFTITNVPPGTYNVVGQRIGYREARQIGVAVVAGQSVTVNFQMAPAVLALQEVVATGLIDPTEGVRSPVTVGRVSREMMPVVASGSAVQNLQGRVAGVSINRGSGQPGAETSIMLRTPTSVTQAGNPLIVVDGVILGSDATSNIESLDIESMEVIKGAAAASLYGSRAAAGVISITTSRGQNLAAGQTRFMARTEIGRTEPLRMRNMPRHHHYLVDNPQNPTTYVNFDGVPVGRAQRVTTPIAFMDTPYPGPVFDNLRSVFRPGNFESHSFSVAQNSADTNFALSLNRRSEQGALENNRGFDLNSFRVNLDHRFLETMSLGVSAYHGRDWRENIIAGSTAATTIFEDVLRAPVDVDLSERDPATGEYLRVVGGDVPFENPLWRQASRESERARARTLGSGNLRWSPRTWVTFVSNVSYDRQDSENFFYLPKGTPTSAVAPDESDGSLQFVNSLNDTWNAEAQVSLRRDFGRLNTRTTARTLLEREQFRSATATGSDFFVGGIRNLNAAATQSVNSNEWEIQALGYLLDTAMDLDGRYILTALVRRDGSSLFGPDNRWHNYYRVAGAWRIGEESWFNLPHVNEFKLSYSQGTAGGRPGFAAQYETWNVTAAGPTKGVLGNRMLRPEHTTEREVSLNAIVAGRFGIELNHAWQRTTDQLVLAPVPWVSGFSGQWQNGGTVSGNTTEFVLEAQVMQTPTFRWMSNFSADRSRGKIEEWPFPCQNPIWRMFCAGNGIYEIWGGHMVRDAAGLTAHHGGAVVDAGRHDEFQVNDDGYLVWVGAGNSFRDGIAKDLWGTSTTIAGRTYNWGMPFLQAREDGSGWRQQIGDASHINLGWVNNFSYAGFSVHTHMHAAVGGDAVNRAHQEMVFAHTNPDMDQAGKPDELKKPVTYYLALEGGTGNDAFLETGDYLKLRSLSVNYRLNPTQLARLGLANIGMESLQIGIIGRNIFTMTNYSGWDPEQALNFADRLSQDRYSYPNTRNYTAEVQITF